MKDNGELHKGDKDVFLTGFGLALPIVWSMNHTCNRVINIKIGCSVD
jgi:hypothetical protein